MGHVLAVVSSLVRACAFIPAAWSGQSCDMMFLKSTKAHTELVLFGVSAPELELSLLDAKNHLLRGSCETLPAAHLG